MRAWAEMFDAFLAGWDAPGADTSAYTDDDYFAYVDGKPRYDGVRDLLDRARHPVARGRPVRPARRRHGVRARQPQERRLQRRARPRRRRPPTRARSRCSTRCATLRMPLAVVSSSVNAPAVLAAAGLADRFVTVVDGAGRHRARARRQARARHLRARRRAACGAAPARSVVVEDAVSGVRAGAAGEFGLVIGVDRGAGARDARRTPAPTSSSSDLGELRPRTAAASAGTRDPTRWTASRFPDRPVGAGRERLRPRRPRRHRDAVRRRQRLPRHARQPRGGPRRATSTARSSTASTRPGRSATPRRRSGSPAPGRRSSTRPTRR